MWDSDGHATLQPSPPPFFLLCVDQCVAQTSRTCTSLSPARISLRILSRPTPFADVLCRSLLPRCSVRQAPRTRSSFPSCACSPPPSRAQIAQIRRAKRFEVCCCQLSTPASTVRCWSFRATARPCMVLAGVCPLAQGWPPVGLGPCVPFRSGSGRLNGKKRLKTQARELCVFPPPLDWPPLSLSRPQMKHCQHHQATGTPSVRHHPP